MNDKVRSKETAAKISPKQDQRKPIINRLKRANGQLAALIQAVENDADCRDVIMQLSAVSKAIDRAGFKILSTELQECVLNPDGEQNVEELEKLFMSLA
ncbi:MAG TPA: metal-sensitive transcriptional regulator [Microbacteriaceae bacterium]|nr:metal-sensitive transcriptional regulator [Microbacteriaceae bacterium]